MIYVMSDLHGCYEEYCKALELIDFSSEDTLYVLGDIVDRGKEPIKILQDMMMRDNVYPIIGNHDYMAMSVLRKLTVEITEDNYETHLTEEDMEAYYRWMQDGGHVTIEQFKALSFEEKQDILDYMDEFALYEEISVNGRDYILVHAGLEPFDENKNLDDYGLQMIFKRCNYDRKYFDDKYVITGHTPTVMIDPAYRGKIYEKNHHIAIDCGCVFGFALGVYCLDTQEKFYIQKEDDK